MIGNHIQSLKGPFLPLALYIWSTHHTLFLTLFFSPSFDLLKHNLTKTRLPFIIRIHYHENKLPTISFTFQIYTYLHIFIVLDFILLNDVSFFSLFLCRHHVRLSSSSQFDFLRLCSGALQTCDILYNSISSIASHFIHE